MCPVGGIFEISRDTTYSKPAVEIMVRWGHRCSPQGNVTRAPFCRSACTQPSQATSRKPPAELTAGGKEGGLFSGPARMMRRALQASSGGFAPSSKDSASTVRRTLHPVKHTHSHRVRAAARAVRVASQPGCRPNSGFLFCFVLRAEQWIYIASTEVHN